MCGIVGVLSAAPVHAASVADMRDQLAHRGPDFAGLWSSMDGQVCLGHRRLSIIDLDASANQPMVSGDGRFVITYNGEIYNYRSLRSELESTGARFRTQSDTEVVIEAYRAWGEQCLLRFSGMFAFALWDNVERELFCARDPIGEKPFYYATLGSTFLFASELKAITAFPGFSRTLDYNAVVDFLGFGFVPDPRTIWRDCAKLPPGHSMLVRCAPGTGAQLVQAPRAYWDLEFTPDHAQVDWGEELRATLMRAAGEMTVADVPVGTFLSGGVDSSGVTAALARSGHQVRTFTIGFDEHGFDERQWAATVASQYKTIHTERVVTAPDVPSVTQKLLWHYDEPFNDYSYLPTYYLCQEARRSVTVALSGDGPDELFAGYRKYQRLGMRRRVRQLVSPGLAPPLLGATERLARGSHARRTLGQYGADDTTALADMLTVGFGHAAMRRMARGPLAEALAVYSPVDTVAALLRRAPPKEVGAVNAMRYLDVKLTLAGDILVKVDRASMAVALEVRPVYLHRDMVALAARIPADLLASHREAKKALKDALRPWLPHDLLFRRKMGFALPLRRWIDPSTSIFDSTSTRVEELLDPALTARLWKDQAEGKVDHTLRIHSLQLLGAWLERWAS